ncbi:putative RTA1 domain protein [Xylogone sp. PMI_703]|nr:putative RTA1 domain protein [Xylogone sp. PMI_703]
MATSVAPDGTILVIALNGSTIPLDDCTLKTCSLVYGEVQYDPSLAANVAYLTVFAVLLFVQAILGWIYRSWGFLVGMSFGLILEIIGYIGRVGLHGDPFSFNDFVIQLVCLTIAPAFLSASIYLCLSRLIVIHGAHFARFQPKTYTYTFITCDIISLILQAAGGGIAASANAQSDKDTGVDVMIAGLVFQVVSLLLFMALSLDFVRYVRGADGNGTNPQFAGLRERPTFRLFPYALAVATITIFIRCVFRVAELQGGFGGKIANDQTVFLIFEGPMIMAAVFVLTVCHPGLCFDGAWKASKWNAEKGSQGTNTPDVEYERIKLMNQRKNSARPTSG